MLNIKKYIRDLVNEQVSLLNREKEKEVKNDTVKEVTYLMRDKINSYIRDKQQNEIRQETSRYTESEEFLSKIVQRIINLQVK